MLPSWADWITHLQRTSGKSVTPSTSITPQAWLAESPLELAPDRGAHDAARAVAADHVARLDGLDLALILASMRSSVTVARCDASADAGRTAVTRRDSTAPAWWAIGA